MDRCVGPSRSLDRQTESLGWAWLLFFLLAKDLDTIVLESPFPGGDTSLIISSGPLGRGTWYDGFNTQELSVQARKPACLLQELIY